MGVIAGKLLKEYQGVPAGTVIQVLDKKYKELAETGFLPELDEVEEAKKKPSKKNKAAEDAELD